MVEVKCPRCGSYNVQTHKTFYKCNNCKNVWSIWKKDKPKKGPLGILPLDLGILNKKREEIFIPVKRDRMTIDGMKALMETLRLIYPEAEVFWDGDRKMIGVRWD